MSNSFKNPDDRDLDTIERKLYSDGSSFDFFQAVRLLEQSSTPSPLEASRDRPSVRFTTPASTAFPASAIDSITRDQNEQGRTQVRVNFMGLTGPSGVLPRHYTELLIQLESRLRGAAKRTLNAWYDLFNNRLINQLYRVWAKCRIDRGLADGAADRQQADPFSTNLYSLVGIAHPTLRDRLQVVAAEADGGPTRVADRVPDTTIVRHVGMLARRQRSARQISAMLSSHFRVPVGIEQFRGQWLELPPEDRTRIGAAGAGNQLGVDAVVGSRVWDRQSRVRVRVGPLDTEQFAQFLPDATPGPGRRRFISLCQLVRFAVGPELDYDVQLVLKESDVPSLQVVGEAPSPRLGWNSWLSSVPLGRDGAEPVFEPIESTEVLAPTAY